MIIFKFSTPCFTIPSVNYMYKPSIGYGKGKRPYPYLYLNTEVREYKEFLTEKTLSELKDFPIPDVTKIDYIISLYIFGLPENSWKTSDTSNLIKATEDAIFNALPGIDDKQVLTPLGIKVIYPEFYLHTTQIFMVSGDQSYIKYKQSMDMLQNQIKIFFKEKSFELL